MFLAFHLSLSHFIESSACVRSYTDFCELVFIRCPFMLVVCVRECECVLFYHLEPLLGFHFTSVRISSHYYYYVFVVCTFFEWIEMRFCLLFLFVCSFVRSSTVLKLLTFWFVLGGLLTWGAGNGSILFIIPFHFGSMNFIQQINQRQFYIEYIMGLH